MIMITGQGDELVATEALKQGALDYIPKSHLDQHSLRRSILNAVQRAALQRQVNEQREELEQFAHVLVHDLRTPLRNIQIFAELAEREVQNENTSKQDVISHCQHIAKMTGRMNALIETVHAYTRVDNPVTFTDTSMNAVFSAALANLASVIAESQAHVTAEALPQVHGHAALLTQLLQNLIANSIKYCQADVPRVHIAARRHREACWLFEVEDNGIGIPDVYQERIFKPFERLHGNEAYEGTGLGLATCKKIVKRHGGDIWCRSKENDGTRFNFTLSDVPF